MINEQKKVLAGIASFLSIFIFYFLLNSIGTKNHVLVLYETNHSIDSATSAADTVLIGTIKKIEPPRWNGKDGKKPSKNSPNMSIIFKPTIVEIEQFLKNPESKSNIKIINVGGKIGNETMTLRNGQVFEQEEKVVLFLRKDVDPGDGIRYYDPIHSYIIQGNLAVNKITGETLPLDQVKTRITKYLNKNGLSPSVNNI